ncbi:hypothetical protein ABK040_008815 [Willaertia magna]
MNRIFPQKNQQQRLYTFVQEQPNEYLNISNLTTSDSDSTTNTIGNNSFCSLLSPSPQHIMNNQLNHSFDGDNRLKRSIGNSRPFFSPPTMSKPPHISTPHPSMPVFEDNEEEETKIVSRKDRLRQRAQKQGMMTNTFQQPVNNNMMMNNNMAMNNMNSGMVSGVTQKQGTTSFVVEFSPKKKVGPPQRLLERLTQKSVKTSKMSDENSTMSTSASSTIQNKKPLISEQKRKAMATMKQNSLCTGNAGMGFSSNTGALKLHEAPPTTIGNEDEINFSFSSPTAANNSSQPFNQSVMNSTVLCNNQQSQQIPQDNNWTTSTNNATEHTVTNNNNNENVFGGFSSQAQSTTFAQQTNSFSQNNENVNSFSYCNVEASNIQNQYQQQQIQNVQQNFNNGFGFSTNNFEQPQCVDQIQLERMEIERAKEMLRQQHLELQQRFTEFEHYRRNMEQMLSYQQSIIDSNKRLSLGSNNVTENSYDNREDEFENERMEKRRQIREGIVKSKRELNLLHVDKLSKASRQHRNSSQSLLPTSWSPKRHSLLAPPKPRGLSTPTKRKQEANNLTPTREPLREIISGASMEKLMRLRQIIKESTPTKNYSKRRQYLIEKTRQEALNHLRNQDK